MKARPGQESDGVLADLTARAESSVDAAGPGRQASRTCPPARNPGSGEGGSRSAPEAAARDPRLPGRIARSDAPEPGNDELIEMAFSPAEPQLNPGAARAVLAMLLRAQQRVQTRGGAEGERT